MTRRIDEMPNLGPTIARRLAEIGVTSEVELRAMGAVAAYRRLKFQFGREITLNALWAMDAALAGTDWRQIPGDRKQQLRKQIADDSAPRQRAGRRPR